MKTIILYCNRQTGITALLYLKAKGYDVLLITDGDESVEWVARKLGLPILPNLEYLRKIKFDLFLSVHGRKIIPKEWLVDGKMVNFHPCLSLGYKGKNPVARYIDNGDELGDITSHYMTEKVDEGGLIVSQYFKTGKCTTYADFYNVANPTYYLQCIEETLKVIECEF